MTVAGEDRVEGGNTVLRARIDLKHVALGAILIGLRPADWTYYRTRRQTSQTDWLLPSPTFR